MTKSKSKKANKIDNPKKTSVDSGMMANSNKKATNNRKEFASVATQHKQVMNRPKITYGPDGSAFVTHREYIADIKSTSEFRQKSFTVNPGDETTFPWLVAIARRFESYLFDQLIFEFETTAGTSTIGTIILALDYDAADAAPISKVQALAYSSSVRSAPWQDCTHISKKSDLNKRKTYYVRSGQTDPNDNVDYDVGNLFVCTSGMSIEDLVMGELYVRYQVKLMTPQLGPSDVQSAKYVATTGATLTQPLGDAPLVQSTVPATYNKQTGAFTFTAPWEGMILFSTGSSPGTILFGSTSLQSGPSLIDSSSGPAQIQIYGISAIKGDILDINTSVLPSSFRLRFAEYNINYS